MTASTDRQPAYTNALAIELAKAMGVSGEAARRWLSGILAAYEMLAGCRRA